VSEQVDPQDLGGQQRKSQPHQRAGQHHGDFRGPARQRVEQKPADVRVDTPAFFGGRDHGAQVIIGQYEVGGLPGDLGTALAQPGGVAVG
jgi:hypothetical protein